MTRSPASIEAEHSLEDAVRHCRDITRRCARNFYYGLKLLPEPRRSAMFTIYAWMRSADDLVDASGGNREEATRAVHLFRAQTQAALDGRVVDENPLWLALASVAQAYKLPADQFHAAIDGQLDDLGQAEYETFDDLRAYCERVGSSVGLICLEIWGYRDATARSLAVDRGIAFQLTNILRDVAEDFDAGRVYLPRTDFARHGLTPRSLRAWSDAGACQRMIHEQIDRAAEFYARSAGLDSLITPDCRPALWAMTSIYRGLLQKMRRSPAQVVLGRRVRLNSFRKAAIAIRARWSRASVRGERGASSIAENSTA